MQKPVGYNKQRAAELMEKQDLDILFISSPLNVYYTTGLPMLHSAPNPILEALSNIYPNFSIIHRNGDVTLVHWIGFASVEEFCWVDNAIPVFTREWLPDTLTMELQSLDLVGCKAGVESDAPKFLLDLITSEDLKMQVQECDEVMKNLRLVKTDEEVARLTRSAEITQKVINSCLGILKEGLTDNELIDFARLEMMKEGADDWNHFTIRFGDSDPEAPGIGRALQRGEIVRLDLGSMYKGYAADLNKHAIIGTADEESKQVLAELASLQNYYEQNIKPGVNINELNEAAFEWAGENLPSGASYAMGHSIGLQVEDSHLFGSFGAPDIEFEENMVFEIEAWMGYQDIQLGVEDLYVVTADGCKRLSSLTPDIHEID